MSAENTQLGLAINITPIVDNTDVIINVLVKGSFKANVAIMPPIGGTILTMITASERGNNGMPLIKKQAPIKPQIALSNIILVVDGLSKANGYLFF